MSAAPRRVLSIATLYPNAHTPRFGTFVARQMEALAARGDWDVTLINPIGTPPLAFGKYRPLAEAAVNGVEHGITIYRPRFTLIPKIGARWNPAAIERAVLPLARKLHAEQPFDLVDAQFFFPDGPAAMRIATALKLPFSIKARGSDIHHWGSIPGSAEQVLEAGRSASGLLAVSDALAGDMAALGIPRDKITVHYTGLDRELFRPLGRKQQPMNIAREFNIPLISGQPLLVTVGTLMLRKGQEYVIRALGQLPGAVLALVGTGPDRDRLETLARSLGVMDRVHFLGSLDHKRLPELLSAANVMVLPSSSEGLANAWVEALACGTPIVICDVGGARELVSDDSAGRLVPLDTQAIANAVSELLAAPPSTEAVAANAARFSWEANAAALAAYYDRLLGSSASHDGQPFGRAKRDQPSPRAARSC